MAPRGTASSCLEFDPLPDLGAGVTEGKRASQKNARTYRFLIPLTFSARACAYSMGKHRKPLFSQNRSKHQPRPNFEKLSAVRRVPKFRNKFRETLAQAKEGPPEPDEPNLSEIVHSHTKGTNAGQCAGNPPAMSALEILQEVSASGQSR